MDAHGAGGTVVNATRRAPAQPARLVTALTLAAAPILQATSTLLWQDGRYGTTGGTVLALSVVLWLTGLVGLLGLLQPRMPVFSALAVLPVAYGGIGSANFAFQGFYEAAFGINQDATLETLASYPVQAGLLLWWSGPLLLAGLFAIGVALWRSHAAPRWAAALLCLAAAAFPLSRIPRIEPIALIIDLLLLAAASGIARRLLQAPAHPAGNRPS